MTTPQNQFTDSRLKVQRANRHIQEIETIFQHFIKTDFYRLVSDVHPQTGKHSLDARSISLPAGIPLSLGDAVHNMRSAFDYISTHYVGKNNTRITFPIGRKRDNLVTSESFRFIEKSVPDLADFIADRIKPYEGGDFKLWEINELDRMDKHKLIIPIMQVFEMAGVSFEDKQHGIQFVNCDITTFGPGTLGLVDSDFPFEVTGQGKTTAHIFFPVGNPFENQPVVPTLAQLAQFTLEAIKSLETFCFGNIPDPNPIKGN